MNLDDPINKDAPHFLVDVDLPTHVALRRELLLFNLLQIPGDWTTVLGYLLRVVLIGAINLFDVLRLDLIDSDSPEFMEPHANITLILETGFARPGTTRDLNLGHIQTSGLLIRLP